MFVHDGQFGFSVFPLLLGHLIDALGPSRAALVLSLLALAVWLVAMAALANRLARGRTVWAILIFVAVLPSEYGGFGAFKYREAFAVPRPFAEAGVLAAVAALVAGRKAIALACLLVGGLLHPLVTLPGAAVALVLWCRQSRRWIVAAVAGSAAAMLAAVFDAPVFGRLFETIDPAWREVLDARSPLVFPRSWPAEAWSTIAVQLTTILIAAHVARGAVRQLFVVVAVLSCGGVGLALLFGDIYPSVLIVQAQPWRAVWLLGVLGAAALALLSIELWRRGPAARLTLALLALAWADSENLAVGLSASALALVSHAMARRLAGFVGATAVMAAWAAVALYAAIIVALHLHVFASVALAKPPEASYILAEMWKAKLHLAIAPLAAAWAISSWRASSRLLAPAAAAALFAGAVVIWDNRSAAQTMLDRVAGDPELTNILDRRPGQVLWLKGEFDTWGWAKRANWVSRMQGAGLVFSRPLAIAWDRRLQELIDLDLVGDVVRRPFPARQDTHSPVLSEHKLARLCAAADAPAWVVVPLSGGAVVADALRPVRWQAPAPTFAPTFDGRHFTWKRTDTYALIPCSASGRH
jgi:hypothetical protein